MLTGKQTTYIKHFHLMNYFRQEGDCEASFTCDFNERILNGKTRQQQSNSKLDRRIR